MPEPVLATDGKISEPSPAPTASGWTFAGWYKEAACTTKWNAEDTFAADTTLYAKWTKNPVAVTITFAGGEGTTLNTGASGAHNGMSGDKITLPACMYTKPSYIFRSWSGTFAGTSYTLPEEAVTFTASWTEITAAISEDDITHALDGITEENAKDYKPQLRAVRDALMTGTATKTDAALINKLSNLFVKAGLGSVTIAGDAKQGVSEVGAILSSDGAAVVLNINKQTTAGKSLPTAYQNEEYKSAWRTISMTVGGTVTASPNPAAAGEEVKLTIEPNDGKKLVAGSLKYSLHSAGAAPVAIDESTLTFIMPAGDININAQFEDDASAPIKNPLQITAFVVNGVSAVINSDTKAITIILPYGTDLKHVAPTIVTANASKVVPSSAQRVDLSTPKAYRVYASNGAYVTYTVTAYTEEPSPTQSLWEKLQNQINSNPNWWELAEYQKKTGYYK